MKDTQEALKEFGNLRLHKFASNDPDVISFFPSDDLAISLKDLDLESDDKPLQRSLGLNWDLNSDNFLFRLSPDDKPVTRRGILSTINSIYTYVRGILNVSMSFRVFFQISHSVAISSDTGSSQSTV
jgi:hypothetical protein